MKIHVAAEIVTARPQRCERRLQPRLQFDEAADRGRGALAHRQPHALEFCLSRAGFPCASRAARNGRCVRGCRGSRQSPTATPNTSAAPARHARSARSSRSAMAKPAAIAAIITAIGNTFCRRSKNAAAPNPIAAAAVTDGDRFMIGGEIAGDPGAECDGHPGQQPAGAGFGANPFAQFGEERRPRAEAATARYRPPAPPRAAARCRHSPAFGLEPSPALPSGTTPAQQPRDCTGELRVAEVTPARARLP